jgi:hypothetical protein
VALRQNHQPRRDFLDQLEQSVRRIEKVLTQSLAALALGPQESGT